MKSSAIGAAFMAVIAPVTASSPGLGQGAGGRKKRSKWTGAELREIRARNGVGRPPRIVLAKRAQAANA